MKLTRRGFLKQLAVLSALGGGGTVYATAIEPNRIKVERLSVALAGLPASLDGIRVAAMSDIHLLPFTQIDLVEEAVAICQELQPDVVTLLGDFVDETAEVIHMLAAELGKLRAPLGRFAVLGNHDVWKGAGFVQRGLERCGITVLRNSGQVIRRGGGSLYIAGVDDVWAGRPDLRRALAGNRERLPTLLLAHEPDYADEASSDPRIRLQLSGHTHGGQIRLPFVGALRLPSWGRKYQAGLYEVGDMKLYTNRGLGMVGVPVRFNCPPEITLLTLRSV